MAVEISYRTLLSYESDKAEDGLLVRVEDLPGLS